MKCPECGADWETGHQTPSTEGPQEPKTYPVEDLIAMIDYVVRYASGIFLRIKDPAGKYHNRALTELSGPQALSYAYAFVARWLESPGYRPFRVRSDEEIAADASDGKPKAQPE
jgi:hypothetical protein